MSIVIEIDAGHGGSDPGTSGNGLREKDLTLDVSLKVGNRLAAHGFDVRYTRTSDVFIGLADRAIKAGKDNANYFLSVHFNSDAEDDTNPLYGTGFESFVMQGYDTGETGRIRSAIHDVVASYFVANGLPNRGKKQASFQVLRETTMSASLLELGFLDNATDASKLKDENFKNGLIEAIVKGVCVAFGIAYYPPVPKQYYFVTGAFLEVNAQKFEDYLKTNGIYYEKHEVK